MIEIKNFHLSDSNVPFLVAKINDLDKSKRYVANVTLQKSTRSLEQNDRLWKMYEQLGNHIGMFKDDVHELMGYKFLRYTKELNGEVVELIKSTTKLNTKEMTEYQEKIELWASQIGFFFEREL
jgi:hypothetical protein